MCTCFETGSIRVLIATGLCARLMRGELVCELMCISMLSSLLGCKVGDSYSTV